MPPKEILLNVTSELVAILWGKEKVTAPVEALTLTWLVVPMAEVTPAFVKVTDPPRDTAPPPDIPVPAVTVTAELAKLALAIAVPPQIPVVIVPVLSKTNLVTPEAEAARIS